MNNNIKKLTSWAMLAALAYIVMCVVKVPVVAFLTYEPKDVIITIGGFIWGPMASLLVSVVVGLVEMVTVSETGIIGCIMNIISSCAFCCTASVIYKKLHTAKGAVIGLASAVVVTTAVMMLWNYLITPYHYNLPREQVVPMLVPVFLVFNLIKCSLNMGIILFVYKPIVKALRKARLVESHESSRPVQKNKKISVGIWVLAGFIVVTCVLAILVENGIL